MSYYTISFGAITAFVFGIFGVIFRHIENKRNRERLKLYFGQFEISKTKYFTAIYNFVHDLEVRSGGTLWSGSVYDWVLRIAVGYPIAAYILTWGLIGHSALGIQGPLPDGADWLTRVRVLLCIGIAIIFFEQGSRARGWTWGICSGLAVGLVGLAAYLTQGGGAFLAIAAVCVASVVSIIGAAQGVSRAHKRLGVAQVFLGGAVAALLFSLLLHIAVADKSYSNAMVVVAISAVISAVFSVGGELARKRGWIGFFLLAQWTIMIAVGFAVSRFINSANWDPAFITLYVLWGVIPFVNSPFDWVSLAATGSLLKRSLKERSAMAILRNCVLDYIVSLLILFGLMTTIFAVLSIYYFEAVRNGNVPVIDPFSVIIQLRSDPWSAKAIWIYVMLSTTLWPTILHSAVCGFSMWTGVSEKVISLPLNLLTEDVENDVFMRAFVSVWLTGFILVLLALTAASAAIIGISVVLMAPVAGDILLNVGEAVAKGIALLAGLLK